VELHPTIQKQASSSAFCADVVGQFVEQWRELKPWLFRPGAPGKWNLLCYCKSGRHRSVAWAMILKDLLEASGFEIVDGQVQHLMTNWHTTCNGQCRQCQTVPTVRDRAEVFARIGQAVANYQAR